MSTDLTLPAGFGALPKAFAGTTVSNDELGNGIAASYAVVGFRGKVWSIKFQGNEEQLMRDDGDGPRNSIEVVLVKASSAVSKIYYAAGYEPGSTAAPDCWSGNGVTPDASVQNKVHPTCADCPMNAWGSKVTEAGKQAKSCADSRRVAVVPIADLHNEAYGGPLLLRVPAASLKDLKGYGDLLQSVNYPYYAAVTRIAFDAKESFPKFVFSAVRPLTDAEAGVIKELREDRRVGVVLAERPDGPAAPTTAAPSVPKSPFEVDQAEGAAEPEAKSEAKAAAKPLSQQAAAAGPSASTVAKASAAKPPVAARAPVKQPEPEPEPVKEVVQEAVPDEVTADGADDGHDGAMDYGAFDDALDAILAD